LNSRAQIPVKQAGGSLQFHASTSFGVLRRTCACGGAGDPGGQCEDCKKKKLQRQATGNIQPAFAPPIVHDVLRSPGRPLDGATRALFEPRFRHDFSRVRIHAGSRAAESAQAVGAHAYAVGRDIVFGASQYSPGTLTGNQLLAHELTHVVQQSSLAGVPSQLIVGSEHDEAETEASSAAAAYRQDSGTFRGGASSPGILRRTALHSGRILDEGTCAELVAGSKFICCDPDQGMERKGHKRDIEKTDCPSEKFSPLFTCDHNCANALQKRCDDTDNWMAIPKSRKLTSKKCNEDLVICAGGKSTHAYIRDQSETQEQWEVSRAIPAALGVAPDFSGSIYGSESDPDFKKDKRCGAVPEAPKAAPKSERKPAE
jgi:Domain of unknown function (DUF4157)